MRVLLDADILCYEMGGLKNPETSLPLPWPLIQDRLSERVDSIIDELQASSWNGYLTGKGNFRNEIATILPYKGNRKREDRPFWYQAIYNSLVEDFGCEVVFGMEADDRIAIEATKDKDHCIICSKDKDLDQVPGWHYNWQSFGQKAKGLYYITYIQGYRNLCKQILTGDSTDNILGLYGVGDKSAAVKRIYSSNDPFYMDKLIIEEYKARFGNYWATMLMENLNLLYLLRTEEEADKWLEYIRKKETNTKADLSTE